MSVGMRKGLFTGKKLGDYIGASGCDYKNARRIINGVDQAGADCGYATTIEGILRGAGARALELDDCLPYFQGTMVR